MGSAKTSATVTIVIAAVFAFLCLFFATAVPFAGDASAQSSVRPPANATRNAVPGRPGVAPAGGIAGPVAITVIIELWDKRMQNENSLVQAFQSGDREAFARLIEIQNPTNENDQTDKIDQDDSAGEACRRELAQPVERSALRHGFRRSILRPAGTCGSGIDVDIRYH